jgi:UDP-N-acetylglucosamine acyltransferase
MSGPAKQVDIHPTAVVEPSARLGQDVQIGAYAVIGGEVVLGDGVNIHPHVVVGGRTKIGAGTEIFPFASIGLQPQDLKYHGEPSRLVIGARNMIREHVTINPGTEGGGMVTSVGDDCLFMVGAHVAHDCQVADNVILANNATLAGHVTVGTFAILGGLSAVHQFARIGDHAIVGGMTGVEHDVIPYGSVKGNRARLAGLNVIGIRRRGFTREQIDGLRRAYKALFGPVGTLQERLDAVAEAESGEAAVMEIVNFIRADSSRSICQPRTDSD